MISRLALWIAGLLALAAPLQAKVFTFAGLNCHCEAPDEWTFRDRSYDLINAVDSERQKCFLLRVVKVNPFLSVDSPSFTQAFDQSFLTNGYNITDHQKVTLAGIPFYKIVATKDLGHRSLNLSAYVALANGFDYLLETTEFNKNPDDDEDMQKIMASFTFITPPAVDQPSSNVFFAQIFRPVATSHNIGFQIGYILGLLIVVALMLACPLGMLALLIGGIYLIVRKTNGPPLAPPPPRP